MDILGISAFYHDSAACLVRDGELIAAAQEERFSRKKHDYRFPRQAAEYCVREAGIGFADLDLVTFYDKPDVCPPASVWPASLAALLSLATPRANRALYVGLFRDSQ